MNKIKTYWKEITIVILIIITLLSVRTCNSYKADAQESTNLVESLNDTMKVWKDKKGVTHSEIKINETSNPNDFININSKDPEIIALQELVKKYKSKLGKDGSVTRFVTETVYDTVYTSKFKPYGKYIWKDSINNKWIDFKYKVDTLKHIDLKLKLIHEYAVINKEKSNGWFKKPTPYSEVVNYNPYSTNLSQTTYKVINDVKPKKFGIGLQFGYGVGANLTSSPYIGIGGSYNLIKF